MAGTLRKFHYQGRDELSLPARPEAFATLKEWLTEIAGELALPPKTQKQLLIAADEIFTNIARYGYPAGAGKASVAVSFDMAEELLTVTFTDSGIAYNPLKTPEPDIPAALEQRQVGGLGIFLVRKMMDFIEYRRESGYNILTLKKKIHRECS